MRFCLIALIQVFFVLPAHAQGVKEQVDRMEIDWGNLTINFYGEMTGKSETSAQSAKVSFLNGETEARIDGQKYLMQKQDELQRISNLPATTSDEDGALDPKKALPEKPKSKNLTFYSSGKVRVDLEIPLATALKPKSLRFLDNNTMKSTSSGGALATDGATNGASGLVLELEAHTKPKAVYTVVDEDGDVLLSTEQVTQQSFKRNLMGRWFKGQHGATLQKAVGPNPVRLQAKVIGEDKFQVSKAAWQNTVGQMPEILAEARIAIILPAN